MRVGKDSAQIHPVPESRRDSILVEMSGSNMARLTEIVQRQQDIIVEYASRSTRPEQTFLRSHLDDATSKWLHGENFQGDGFEISYYLSKQLDRKQIVRNNSELLSWDFNIFEKGSNMASLVKLAREIISVFEFGVYLPNLSMNELDKSVEECVKQHCEENPFHNAVNAVDNMHATALCLLNLESPLPECSKMDPATWMNPIDVLGCLFASLVCTMNHPGRTEAFLSQAAAKNGDFHVNSIMGSVNHFYDTILSKYNFLAGVSKTDQLSFRNVICECAQVTSGNSNWSVVQNIDLVTAIIIDAHKQDAVSDHFDNVLIAKRYLLQGIFRAAQESKMCRNGTIAMEWLLRLGKELKVQGDEEVKLGLQVNKFADTDLLALNLIDFSTAPLWVALSLHIQKMQQPIGYLILNRDSYEKKLLVNCQDRLMQESVALRTHAFSETFANVRFEPFKLNSMNSNENSNDKKWDFIAVQEQSLRAIGSSTAFLSHLNKTSSHNAAIRMSLTDSIGFLENVDSRKKTATFLDPREMANDSIASRKHVQVLPEQLIRKPITRSSSFNMRASFVNGLTLNRESATAKRINQVLQDNCFQFFMAALTTFALFGDDFKIAFFEAPSDPLFDIFTTITFVFFTVEIILKTMVQIEYRWGMFFLLDTVATITLLLDTSWFMDWFTQVTTESQFKGSTSELFPARAFRSATRASRIIRVIRVVRLLRLIKLYQYFSARQSDETVQQKRNSSKSTYLNKYVIKRKMSSKGDRKRVSSISSTAPPGDPDQPKSKVGTKLADLTTRRVILIVLTILVWNSALASSTGSEALYQTTAGLFHATSFTMVKREIVVNDDDEAKSLAFKSMVDAFILKHQNTLKVIGLGLLKQDGAYFGNLEEQVGILRSTEFEIVKGTCSVESDTRTIVYTTDQPLYTYCTYEEADMNMLNISSWEEYPEYLDTYMMFSYRDQQISDATMNVLNTWFIIIILGLATYLFTTDANRLVIAPIERMVLIVEELAKNPLTTFENDDVDDNQLIGDGKNKVRKRREEDAYETKLLENCLKKIGGLLQVGFGEAGAEIIASNMNGTGQLDPMIPGRKIQAIFGFCDIRNFMKTTEILSEEVMMYVNEIASIVHTQVSLHSGCANRNMGDSFLLIWKKMPGSFDTWTNVAEKSLISFLKVMIEISRNKELENYTSANTAIGKRLLEFIPNFKINLGFGLHRGWAIEGAVGSSRKIDASYLSPHVNLTSRLEEVTRNYGTDLIFSSDFYENLGPDARKSSRKIDHVLLKGTSSPIGLYTYDCHTDGLSIKLQAIRLKGDPEQQEIEQMIFSDRRISLIGPSAVIDHRKNLAAVKESAFRTDLELRALQWEIPPHFLPLCRKGVNVYLQGDWAAAKVLMEAACEIRPSEATGPCGKLLEYMKTFDFKSPEDWTGVRKL